MATDIAQSPRINSAFELEVQDLNRFLVQEVDTPDVSLNEVTFGQPWPLPDMKTPGKMSVGDLVIRKIKPIENSDTWIWDWLAGAMLLPNGNKRPAFLREMANDGTVMDTYFLGLVWPKQIAGISYSRDGDGDKIMEECTFACTYFVNTNSNAFKQLLNI